MENRERGIFEKSRRMLVPVICVFLSSRERKGYAVACVANDFCRLLVRLSSGHWLSLTPSPSSPFGAWRTQSINQLELKNTLRRRAKNFNVDFSFCMGIVRMLGQACCIWNSTPERLFNISKKGQRCWRWNYANWVESLHELRPKRLINHLCIRSLWHSCQQRLNWRQPTTLNSQPTSMTSQRNNPISSRNVPRFLDKFSCLFLYKAFM